MNDDFDEALRNAASGDAWAKAHLLEQYRSRLKTMVRLRLNRRLEGQVNAFNIVQDALITASRHLPEYMANPLLPFHLWLRQITSEKLQQVHRAHLGAQTRDADRQISLHRGAVPRVDARSLAIQFMGRPVLHHLDSRKAEMRIELQVALNCLEPLEREMLALRHFEQLSKAEAALELGLNPSDATRLYFGALARLQAILLHAVQ